MALASLEANTRRIGNVYYASFGGAPRTHDPADLADVLEQIRWAVDNIHAASREIAADNAELATCARRSSKRLMRVIGMIDGVAFGSRLLALNAAAQAARAGSDGHSVALVAAEVRNLVQKSAIATREIQALVRDTLVKFEASTRLVDEVGQTMGGVVDAVRQLTELLLEAANAESVPVADAPSQRQPLPEEA